MNLTVNNEINSLDDNLNQTSCAWPLKWVVGEELISSQSVGFDVGSALIMREIDRAWEEVFEEVLFEYSEAWEKLAGL